MRTAGGKAGMPASTIRHPYGSESTCSMRSTSNERARALFGRRADAPALNVGITIARTAARNTPALLVTAPLRSSVPGPECPVTDELPAYNLMPAQLAAEARLDVGCDHIGDEPVESGRRTRKHGAQLGEFTFTWNLAAGNGLHRLPMPWFRGCVRVGGRLRRERPFTFNMGRPQENQNGHRPLNDHGCAGAVKSRTSPRRAML